VTNDLHLLYKSLILIRLCRLWFGHALLCNLLGTVGYLGFSLNKLFLDLPFPFSLVPVRSSLEVRPMINEFFDLLLCLFCLDGLVGWFLSRLFDLPLL
jgi:hypothetical protein